jgi:hypothetical protein
MGEGSIPIRLDFHSPSERTSIVFVFIGIGLRLSQHDVRNRNQHAAEDHELSGFGGLTTQLRPNECPQHSGDAEVPNTSPVDLF